MKLPLSFKNNSPAERRFLTATALFVVILSFFLAHQYWGIDGDAILYLLDVIHGMFPERFVGDLYFIGSTQQGKFSIFSWIYKPLILTLGTYWAAFVLATISICLWIFASVLVIRRFAPRHAILIFVFFACFAFGYGPTSWLRMGEWFCTSRTLAEALTLFGIAFLPSEKKWTSGVFFLLGAAFHPLVGGWGLPIWCFYFFPKTKIPVAVLSALFPLTVFIGKVPFAAFDSVWADAMEEFDWTLAGVLTFVGYAVATVCAWKMFFQNKGKFFLAVFPVLAIAAYWTLFANLSGHIFLYQVQPFRAEWILLFLVLISMAHFVCEILQRGRAKRLFVAHRAAFLVMASLLLLVLILQIISLPQRTKFNGGVSQLIYVYPNIFLFVGSFLAVLCLVKRKFPLFGVAYGLALAVIAWAIWHEGRFGPTAEFRQLDIFLKSREAPFERVVQNDYAHVYYLSPMKPLCFATGSYFGDYAAMSFSRDRFLASRHRVAQITNEPAIEQKPFTYPYYGLLINQKYGLPETAQRLLESGEVRFVVTDSTSFFGRAPKDSLYLEALGKTAYLYTEE